MSDLERFAFNMLARIPMDKREAFLEQMLAIPASGEPLQVANQDQLKATVKANLHTAPYVGPDHPLFD